MTTTSITAVSESMRKLQSTVKLPDTIQGATRTIVLWPRKATS